MKSSVPIIICLFLFALFTNISYAAGVNSIKLSPDARISLLTCSPGKEIYSLFGHSAVRVHDPESGLDIVFNYGTFDFDTPNFELLFLQGRLLYKLTVSTMEQFIQEYYYAGRGVYEQVLNLSTDEMQRVFDFMMVNRLPENAYYLYDFFFDNCATRIRDLADSLLHVSWANDMAITPEILESVRSKLNYEFHYMPDPKLNRSFRDLLHPYLERTKWIKFGIDLLLGMPSDRAAKPYEFMYLPDEMLIAFARASINNNLPLVSEHNILLRKTMPERTMSVFQPNIIMWAVFIVALISLLKQRYSRIFDITFFNILGVFGLVIFFMWFMSDHGATKTNLNLLWALPTHLFFVWKANYNYLNRSVRIYFGLSSICALVLLISWPILPQHLNPAFFPLILTLFIKSMFYTLKIPFLTNRLLAV